MWLTNKLQWAPSSGQLCDSSPRSLQSYWAMTPGGEAVLSKQKLQNQILCPTQVITHSSFLILIPNQGLHLNSQDDPQLSRSSHYYFGLSLWGKPFPPSLMQLPDPPSLCIASHRYKETLLVKEPSRVDQGERDSGSCYKDCPWNPRLISEGFRSYNI